MRKLSTWRALGMLLAGVACAQDISGDWQGDLVDGGRQLRVVFRIAKTDGGAWTATMYSIDQNPRPMVITSISLTGNTVNFEIKPLDVTYTGTLNPDGNTISGSATQGGQTHALNLTGRNQQLLADADVILGLDVMDLYGTLVKTQDNAVTRYLYRPVSLPLTRVLAWTPITPIQISYAVAALVALGCWVAAHEPDHNLGSAEPV